MGAGHSDFGGYGAMGSMLRLQAALMTWGTVEKYPRLLHSYEFLICSVF